MKNNLILAERLRKARGDRSQSEFARFLGLANQQSYSRYEAGREPRASVLHQIASRIGVTPAYLLGVNEDLDTETSPPVEVVLASAVEGGIPQMTDDELWQIAKEYWKVREQFGARARLPIRHGLELVFREILSRF